MQHRATPGETGRVLRHWSIAGCGIAAITILTIGALTAEAQAPTPIVGFADLHNHQFSNLGFGGAVVWGEPFDPGGIQAALPHCDFLKFNTLDYLDNVFTLNEIPDPILGYPEHGVGGISDMIGNGVKIAAGLPGVDCGGATRCWAPCGRVSGIRWMAALG
jgi:hypothetical protein